MFKFTRFRQNYLIVRKIIIPGLLFSIVLFIVFILKACGSNDATEDLSLNIVSISVGGMDLNSPVPPDNVPVDASIKINFNSDINPETALESNILLFQNYDGEDVELNISVSGSTLTIKPVINFGTGVLYELDLKMGLLNTDNLPLAQTSRTFRTAGTFSPAGIIANWTFENNVNDVAGKFNPASDGVVDITFTEGLNSVAGTAAMFNGNTSIIEIPNGDQLINTRNFTINFWVKTNSEGHVNKNGDPAGHFVIGLGAFFGLQYEIFSDYTEAKFAMQFEAADGTPVGEELWFPSNAQDASTGGWQGWDFARSLSEDQMIAMLKDNWLHVSLTFSGDDRQAILYYNGEIMKSFDFDLWPDNTIQRTVAGMKYNGQEPEVFNEFAFGFIQSRAGSLWENELWGGYTFPGANHFKGKLDDIKIFHKALTEKEIRLMYESEKYAIARN